MLYCVRCLSSAIVYISERSHYFECTLVHFRWVFRRDRSPQTQGKTRKRSTGTSSAVVSDNCSAALTKMLLGGCFRCVLRRHRQRAEYCSYKRFFLFLDYTDKSRYIPHVALSEVVQLVPRGVRLSHRTALECAPARRVQRRRTHGSEATLPRKKSVWHPLET